jgi:hypothetical protein
MTFEASFLDEWHRIVADRDEDALDKILAEDITLGAPPYWAKLEGREVVRTLLGFIINTIEEFTYHREWAQRSHLAQCARRGSEPGCADAPGERGDLPSRDHRA